MSEDNHLNIGKISAVFGVKGWLKVFSYTDPKENIFNYSPWKIKRNQQQEVVQIQQGKVHGKNLIVQLDGVDDRTQAEQYLGWDILIEKNQLEQPAEDEYYWVDLIGLAVMTEQGFDLGQVDHLIETGANDVLVTKQNDHERLIPLIFDQVIKDIDLDKGLIRVDWDPDF